MYSKEREIGVRHGIDQIPNLVLSVVVKLVVIASEAYYAFSELDAVLAGEAGGLDAATSVPYSHLPLPTTREV